MSFLLIAEEGRDSKVSSGGNPGKSPMKRSALKGCELTWSIAHISLLKTNCVVVAIGTGVMMRRALFLFRLRNDPKRFDVFGA